MRSSLRRRASLGTACAVLGVGLTTLSAHPAAAQTVVYNNTTTFTGSAYAGGGAAATGPTALVADDITPIAGFTGQAVTSFSFSVANLNTASTTFAPTALFYASDGSGGGPGTLLGGVNFSAIAQGSGVAVYTAPTNAAGYFFLPSGFFWAGLAFSGASQAALNNLGQGIFGPPTVGSSQDAFFQSSAPATTAGSPAGSFFNFGGSPAANFGWKFTVANPVPEASTTVSLGLLLTLGLGGIVTVTRRKKA